MEFTLHSLLLGLRVAGCATTPLPPFPVAPPYGDGGGGETSLYVTLVVVVFGLARCMFGVMPLGCLSLELLSCSGQKAVVLWFVAKLRWSKMVMSELPLHSINKAQAPSS
jgi:hypothetical protein